MVVILGFGYVWGRSVQYTSDKNNQLPSSPSITQAQITDQPKTNNQPQSNKLELMKQNDPNIKKLSFATADYVGKNITLYALAETTDYYNYGFRDEMKYYSLRLSDSSVGSSSDYVYAYIDKTKTDRKAQELVDILLKEPTFLKIEANIPAEKYQVSSNAFLEIDNWETVK